MQQGHKLLEDFLSTVHSHMEKEGSPMPSPTTAPTEFCQLNFYGQGPTSKEATEAMALLQKALALRFKYVWYPEHTTCHQFEYRCGHDFEPPTCEEFMQDLAELYTILQTGYVATAAFHRLQLLENEYSLLSLISLPQVFPAPPPPPAAAAPCESNALVGATADVVSATLGTVGVWRFLFLVVLDYQVFFLSFGAGDGISGIRPATHFYPFLSFEVGDSGIT